MLRPGSEAERGRSAGMPEGDDRAVNQGVGSAGTYISHGAFGPNGLYRAHGERAHGERAHGERAHQEQARGERSAGRGFAVGRPATRPSGVAGRGFGDAAPQMSMPLPGGAQANAGFGGAAGRMGVSGLAAVVGANPPRLGGPGAQPPSQIGGGNGRTPELQLLIVDEDESARETCAEMGGGLGFNVIGVATIAAARNVLRHQAIDLLLVDLKLPAGADGMALVEEVRRTNPQIAVVVTTANASVDSAVEAIRIGAGDYLTKPFVPRDLSSVLERVGHSRQFDIESRLLRERLRTPNGMGKLIGRSPEMEKLYRILSKVAHSTHPVLILGESGTGKEMVARSIHENGPNAAKPFIPVDCTSLVSTLIESELFGYVKGAFTGANKTKEGLLAAADGGTVFLDEIGEIPLDLQAKLLRALQEKEVRPVGANHTVPISARVLAATNRDLATMVEQGRFRKDLYFRLNVVSLRIPPLRDRREDIPVLALHFLEKMRQEKGVPYELTDDTLWTMTQYDWPGNVRELENAVERACALCSGPRIQMADLPTQLQEFRLQGQRLQAEAAAEAGRTPPGPTTLRDAASAPIRSIAEMEKNAILGTIETLQGDKLLAAKLLGIGKTTLYRKLKEYGVAEDAEEN